MMEPRRARRQSPPPTLHIPYDGDELVAECGSSGTLLRRYAHGLGVDDPILWYEGAGPGDRPSLQSNHQGAVINVANNSGASHPFAPDSAQHRPQPGKAAYTATSAVMAPQSHPVPLIPEKIRSQYAVQNSSTFIPLST